MQRSNTVDVLVCGGGTSGAALAGILARDTDANILLLEAGPDYGALDGGCWPDDLLDARRIPETHGWGYSGAAHRSHTNDTPFERARVIGGCSSHNGCVALLGHRRDYDQWSELGNAGWDWESVRPAFDRAIQHLQIQTPRDEDVTPFHRSFINGAVAAGIPLSSDMNDPDEHLGVGASPVNVVNGVRWNTALAYLDPVRPKGNLTIIGNALVDRVEVSNGRAIAVHALVDGKPRRFAAERIVLAGGAYGSPAILLRSGIGPSNELSHLGIDHVHELPGVGKTLADHPAVNLRYLASAKLNDEMTAFGKHHWLPDEQSLAKARSSICREAFDLHLYAVAGWKLANGGYTNAIAVSSVWPKSTGTIGLRSADPIAAPVIDHNYLSDPDDEDLCVLLDGVELAREVMKGSLASGLLTEEQHPGPSIKTRDELADFVRRTVGIYYHPACSCRMGSASDPTAVVDSSGKVHGIDDLYVCDASIFPTLMRANTNLPAAMLAEYMAPLIGQR